MWGGGGGGGGASQELTSVPFGGGGGAGGFAWCAVPVTPGTAYPVVVGQGGAGSPSTGQDGADGADTTMSGDGGVTATARGGAGGRFGGHLPLTTSPGGMGTCQLTSGTTRQGAAGQPPVTADGPAGQGGQPAVNGIVEPTPSGAGAGGDGGALHRRVAPDGGAGYAVIWW
ncbi:glycine-rich domain-containing protein [Streptomyces sp. NPDC002574]|uniref:glycine-rich domain-containing protein n=1 Tax=Streptomyces sp. NPDC002574 TaxID=3364652 RepID=UPI0036927955